MVDPEFRSSEKVTCPTCQGWGKFGFLTLTGDLAVKKVLAPCPTCHGQHEIATQEAQAAQAKIGMN